MIRRVAIFFVIICSMFSVAAFLAVAAHPKTDNTAATISGISGVYLVFEKPDNLANPGLDNIMLRQTIERTLAIAGIPILTEKQFLKNSGAPYLYFHFHTANDQNTYYAYHVRAQLRQTVRLDRDPKIILIATTWQSTEPVGIIDKNMVNIISAAVEKCASEFAVAYLKANQK